jgi:hypothetical protein
MISTMTGSINREVHPVSGTAQGKPGLLAVPRGRADLPNHGAAYGCSWRRSSSVIVLGRWTKQRVEARQPSYCRCAGPKRKSPSLLEGRD